MNTYKLSNHIEYDGSGYGFALVLNKEVIKLVYLRDIIHYADEIPLEEIQDFLLKHERKIRSYLMPFQKAIESGEGIEFSFGMISCWEFVEL